MEPERIERDAPDGARPICLDDRLREVEASLISWALTVSRGNDNDQNTARQDGGASIYASTIYLIDLVIY